MSKKAGWISAGVIASLIAGGAVYASTSKADTSGEVLRIVDGDTLDIRIGGEDTRVRLLSVDTPETVDPNKSVECLGPEATEYLHSLVSPGDKVDLKYDIERTDRYGRTLAAVYKGDQFINKQIAAAGMGIAVKFEPNVRFYPEILEAQNSAELSGEGLFDTAIDCTIPSQLDNANAALSSLSEVPSDTVSEASERASHASAAIAAGLGVKKLFDTFTPSSHPVTYALLAGSYHSAVQKLDRGIKQAEKTLKYHEDEQKRLAKAEQQRKEAEQKKKAEEQAKQKAVSEAHAARQAAERRAAAERQAANERVARQTAKSPKQVTVQRPVAPKTTSKPKAKPRTAAPTKAPKSGYTGPRCYAPGGKTWRPC